MDWSLEEIKKTTKEALEKEKVTEEKEKPSKEKVKEEEATEGVEREEDIPDKESDKYGI